MISATLNFLGLIASIFASYLLSKNLFISDNEIKQLSELPIEKSSTNLSTGDGISKPVALIPPVALDEYRKSIIQRRIGDRTEGKKGFAILIAGFGLQVVALFLDKILNL